MPPFRTVFRVNKVLFRSGSTELRGQKATLAEQREHSVRASTECILNWAVERVGFSFVKYRPQNSVQSATINVSKYGTHMKPN